MSLFLSDPRRAFERSVIDDFFEQMELQEQRFMREREEELYKRRILSSKLKSLSQVLCERARTEEEERRKEEGERWAQINRHEWILRKLREQQTLSRQEQEQKQQAWTNQRVFRVPIKFADNSAEEEPESVKRIPKIEHEEAMQVRENEEDSDEELRQAIELSKIDHEKERMRQKLREFGLSEKPVKADGNCQFRALADQLYGDEEKHLLVRKSVVDWLIRNEEYSPHSKEGTSSNLRLSDFLDTDKYKNWSEYCKKLAKEGTWGDHLSLLAAAEAFRLRIHVFSSLITRGDGNQGTTLIEGGDEGECHDVYLTHWHENHYGSLQECASE